MSSRPERWRAVKAQVAALEAGAGARAGVRAFGDARVDGVFPQGGLPLGRWHEIVGEGLEIETAAAAAGFTAALARPLAQKGVVVWVMRRDDLHAPGLFGLGFPAQRLIQVAAPSEAEALAAFEDALGTAGVACAIAEADDIDLTVGRRFQLACERRGATGFVIRRRPFGAAAGSGKTGTGSAAATRWTVAPAPSDPRGEPGLGAPRWRVALERCRGGRPGSWLMEMSDGPQALAVASELGDHGLEAPLPFRRAG